MEFEFFDNFRVNFSPSETYWKKLQTIKILLEEGNDVQSNETIINHLGNHKEAFRSIPTALYCFLRAQTDIPHIEVSRQRLSKPSGNGKRNVKRV